MYQVQLMLKVSNKLCNIVELIFKFDIVLSFFFVLNMTNRQNTLNNGCINESYNSIPPLIRSNEMNRTRVVMRRLNMTVPIGQKKKSRRRLIDITEIQKRKE